MADLLLRRRQMMGSVLPAGYTKLAWIGTTGTQYIDTGIIPTVANGTYLEIVVARTTQKSNQGFGSNYNLNVAILSDDPNTWRVNGITTQKSIINDEFITLVLRQSTNGRFFQIDGESGYGSAAEYALSFTLGILNGYPINKWDGKFASCKIWEGGILVKNLVPCRRESDQELGMYDTVGKAFFTNAGTGNFTAP